MQQRFPISFSMTHAEVSALETMAGQRRRTALVRELLRKHAQRHFPELVGVFNPPVRTRKAGR